MRTTNKTMVVLGGSGFIGQHLIQEAVKAGWIVKALVRSTQAADCVSALGALAFHGEAEHPAQWIHEAQGASALVDLVQPRFPSRISNKIIQTASQQRQRFAHELVNAVNTLKSDQQPVLLSVSGLDDLAPDQNGCLSASSPLRKQDYGFNRIGIPVRRVVEKSKVKAAFVCLGTVYGPGKGFESSIFPQIAKGKWKNFGNRMAVIHVEDVARGLVRVAELAPGQATEKTFVLVDDCSVDMQTFFGFAANCIGAAAPGRIPTWLATLFAGRTMVESILCELPIRSSIPYFADFQLRYPSYREGLPVTLAKLGYSRTLRTPLVEVKS